MLTPNKLVTEYTEKNVTDTPSRALSPAGTLRMAENSSPTTVNALDSVFKRKNERFTQQTPKSELKTTHDPAIQQMHQS